MSGMAQLKNEDGSDLMDYATYKKCFNSAFFYSMKHDALGNKKADYTKCSLYKHYGMTPDWTEFNEETTTEEPTTWTMSTLYSTEATTQPIIDDDDNLIPNGVKCQGNIASSKIVGGDNVKPHSWPWIVKVK